MKKMFCKNKMAAHDDKCGYESDSDVDSEGSLCDFIVDSSDDTVIIEDGTVEDEQVELVESYTVDDKGVRRSTREKKQVEQYVDPDHVNLLLEGEPASVLLADSTDESETDEESEWTTDSELAYDSCSESEEDDEG